MEWSVVNPRESYLVVGMARHHNKTTTPTFLNITVKQQKKMRETPIVVKNTWFYYLKEA
jgi:hypothetical protein